MWWKALLALVVALALQVGVNYANDYSDGIRGTDADRVGPMRLVGSGTASPGAVKRAAFAAFGVAAVAGLVLAATTAWWLVAVGALCVVAAWFYTGGSKPYGYLGLGEVMVFVLLRAGRGGRHDVRPDRDLARSPALYAAVGIGALACAILVANNLRDIPTDRGAGKLHARRPARRRAHPRPLRAAARRSPLVALVGVALTTSWWALLALVYAVPSPRRARRAGPAPPGPGLIPVLQLTGVAELLYGAGPAGRPRHRHLTGHTTGHTPAAEPTSAVVHHVGGEPEVAAVAGPGLMPGEAEAADGSDDAEDDADPRRTPADEPAREASMSLSDLAPT